MELIAILVSVWVLYGLGMVQTLQPEKKEMV
jgi:hypothetical protein